MKSKAKTPKQNVRCNFCGCAFVPEPKKQREGEMPTSQSLTERHFSRHKNL